MLLIQAITFPHQFGPLSLLFKLSTSSGDIALSLWARSIFSIRNQVNGNEARLRDKITRFRSEGLLNLTPPNYESAQSSLAIIILLQVIPGESPQKD